MSRTLCVFKPDLAANRRDVAHALLRLLAVDLVPTRLQWVHMTIAQALRLYAAHEGQPYHRRNIDFMTSGPCMVMVLDGEHAVERLREVVGSTDPKLAQPGTLRRMFGTELPRNAVHASASEQEAADEIRIFFNDEGEVGAETAVSVLRLQVARCQEVRRARWNGDRAVRRLGGVFGFLRARKRRAV